MLIDLRTAARRLISRKLGIHPFDPSTLERGIPPPGINYNQVAAEDASTYVRTFKEQACLKELPFLMRQGLTPGSALLDYGCGLGRMAYAVSKYLDPQRGAYFGYEPNQTSLTYLRDAWAPLPHFHFAGTELPPEEDYIAIHQQAQRTGGTSAGLARLGDLCTRPIDVQYSSSVFTHMWRNDIVALLKEMTRVLAPAGVCVNTWLCVDDFAAYILRCGLADRTLQHRVKDVLTYSLDNPLTCAAYEWDTVQGIYHDAGHEITEVLWGSWSGRDNGVHYQDIIVSRPRH